MSDETKYLLGEEKIPHSWYNIVADLPSPPPPVLHPGTGKPVGPDDLSPLFPMALIGQEVSAEREIEIPKPVRDIYRMWRPTPLYRARRLEKALGTTARIFYKYEGVSPAGSHKPNTAVAQAFYNKQEGVKKLSTETGAGQWGSSLAFAGALFGLEVKVYMVKVCYNQKPYRRALMETYGAQCVASPSSETESGRAILEAHPDSPGSLGIAISEAVEVAAKNHDTKYSLGSVLNHVLLHQTVIGHEAIAQMEAADAYPDVVIGCAGGGSNFAGIAFPFIGETARQARRAGDRGRAGRLSDADAGHLRLRLRRHRASDAAGEDAYARIGVHAARLPRRRPALSRHGAAGQPHQGAGADRGPRLPPDVCFEAGVLFARTEGIVPAPESTHAIRAAIDEAVRPRRKACQRPSSSTSPATATSTCKPIPTTSPANWTIKSTTPRRSRRRWRICRRWRRSRGRLWARTFSSVSRDEGDTHCLCGISSGVSCGIVLGGGERSTSGAGSGMLTTTSGAGASDGVGGRTTSGCGTGIGSFAIAVAPKS